MPSVTLPPTARTQAFVDGEFTDAADGATFDSLAPASGHPRRAGDPGIWAQRGMMRTWLCS